MECGSRIDARVINYRSTRALYQRQANQQGESAKLTVRPTDLALVGMVHRRSGMGGTVGDRDAIGKSGMGMTEVMGRQNRNKEQRQID
jgi:hypothetical protein